MFHPEGPTFLELCEQALSSVERGYDLLAPRFDVTPYRTPDDLLAACARAVGAQGSVGSMLDLCCGTGAALEHLRPRCSERAVGLDLSAGMLAQARRKLEAQPGAPFELLKGDALSLPEALHGAFDLVTCFGAFGHVLPRDERRFVQQVALALRPGGRFVFVSGERPARWSGAYLRSRAFNLAMRVRNAVWSPPFVMYYLTFLLPECAALLRSEGFEVRVQRGVLPPPYAAYSLVTATRR